MQSLVVLLREWVFNSIQIPKPALYGLKLRFVTFVQFFLDLHDVLFQLDQLLTAFGFDADHLQGALDLLEQFLAVFDHAVIGPADYSVSVVVDSGFQGFPQVAEIYFDESSDSIEWKQG